MTKVAGSDDIVMSYTYAEATSLSGGLWNLDEGDLGTPKIDKNLQVKNSDGDTTFELDRSTGVGDFIGIKTGFIASKGVEPVSMAGGLKIDNDTNVTLCELPQHKGIMRSSTQCTTNGGTVITSGTDKFCRFNGASCPSGWIKYQNWGTYTARYCSSGCSFGDCTTAARAWSNAGPPTCTYAPNLDEDDGG